MERHSLPASMDGLEQGRIHRNDSFRKVLPTKPSTNVDSRLSMSGRMIERPSLTMDKGVKPYAPFILEYTLLAEYQLFQKKEIPGIYVNPSDRDPLLWFGVMFIHHGLYEGGIFRFEVIFPSSFPDGECPRVIFDRNMFHPAISQETGDLNVAAEFGKWQKSVHHVWQLLQYVKEVFLKVDDPAPLNSVAAELLIDKPDAFERAARACASASRQLLFSTPNTMDMNYICFEPYSDSIHGALIQQISKNEVFAPPSDS